MFNRYHYICSEIPIFPFGYDFKKRAYSYLKDRQHACQSSDVAGVYQCCFHLPYLPYF